MLIRLLLSSLLLNVIVNINADVIDNGNIIFNTISGNHNKELIEISNDITAFYSEYLDFQTTEYLSIIETETLQEMQKKCNTPSFIGGFYMEGISYIQPINILKRKDVLRKTIFIEYGHFILDTYTGKRIPGWFNEGLTSYIYTAYSHRGTASYEIISFDDFINFGSVIGSRDKLNSFYYTFYVFIEKINKKVNDTFIIDILKSMRKGNDFDTAFRQITKMNLRDFFEDNVK